MKNLELSIEKEINFMTKYQLTADEFFLMKLIWYAQDDHPEYLSKYFAECKLGKEIRELLMGLRDKEIINKSYTIPEKGEIFNPNDVDFNKNVIKSFMQHSQDLGMELFENYPAYTYINGRPFSLRNITKLYKSLDEMCFDYGQSIKFNPQKHKEVLEILEYARDNNLINNGICTFIAERQWDMFQQMRDEDTGEFKTSELI